MQTKEQVTHAFKAELQALLDKYGAELEAKDFWQGYAECGEDVRMEVTVPAIYDADHNCVREWTDIDLGAHIWPTPNAVAHREAACGRSGGAECSTAQTTESKK